MATTEDMAPNRAAEGTASKRTTPGRRSTKSRAATRSAEADLQVQINRLQDDIKAIANSLTRVGKEKVAEGRGRAKIEYKNLLHTGEQYVDAAMDEFGQVEKQIKDTIRERPLTAVASAIGIGFLLAVLTR